MRNWAAAAFLLLSIGHAQAQWALCPDNRTTQDAITCFGNALADAQAALAAKIVDVRAIRKAEDFQAQVTRSQQAWEASVQQTCDGLVSLFWQGGTIRIPATLQCKAELTRERTADLDRLFNVPLHH